MWLFPIKKVEKEAVLLNYQYNKGFFRKIIGILVRSNWHFSEI